MLATHTRIRLEVSLLELVQSFEEERIVLPIVPSTPVGLCGEAVPKKGCGEENNDLSDQEKWMQTNKEKILVPAKSSKQ
jgi:hypothetical protein